MNGETSQEALWGMVSKQIILIKDVIKSKRLPTEAEIAEWLGDIHNYLYLLEAIWTDAKEEE